MIPIITHSDLNEYKHISTNISAAIFNNYLQEAQELDLRLLLGEELYIDILDDIVASPSLTDYEELVNGSTYEYNEKKYKHEGLKSVLAYFAYSRYLKSTGVNSTHYGLVVKKNDFSEPISEKTLARQISQSISAAHSYWDRVKLFLIHNKNDYPLFKCQVSAQGSIRVTAIGGNSSDRKTYYK